ncbi:hypothetical protein OC861_006592 [Tilletia horrida]|nr:hypothetical protein OC861_006592 [Tilletia horrida]
MLTLSSTKTWAFRLAGIAILAHMMTFVMAAHLNAELYRLPLAARAGKVVPNQNCVNDSNCASGHCLPGYDERCDLLNPDGSPAECNGFDNSPYGFENYSAYCAGFPLNHTCANQGECRNGFCNSKGICVKTKVGQACKDDLGCSGSQVCKSGKCFAPPVGSLYPQESCKIDCSCKSGRCVTVLTNENSYSGQKYNVRPTCDFLATGQKGCLSPHVYPYYQLTRPDYNNPGEDVRAYEDYACATSKFGGQCKISDDCLQGNCVSGICKGKPLKSTCSNDKDCTSLTCIVPDGQKTGKCAISQSAVACTKNSTCYSGVCSDSPRCYDFQTGCGDHLNCAPKLNGTCRIDGDCAYGLFKCETGQCVYSGFGGR